MSSLLLILSNSLGRKQSQADMMVGIFENSVEWSTSNKVEWSTGESVNWE